MSMTVERAAEDRDRVARPALPIPDGPLSDPLAGLLRLIQEPPKVPEVGVAAAQAMENCFETTARDIEQIAQDAVDRALALQQEAKSFASILRQSGSILCGRIEREATRGFQVSMLMREARKMVEEVPIVDGVVVAK